MKKIIVCLTVLGLLLVAGVAFAFSPIKLMINGVEVKSDVAPTFQNGRVMVPIRIIAESLGYLVRYDDTNNTVYITTPQKEFKAYHDIEDFRLDYKLIIQCLEEAGHNLDNAFMDRTKSAETYLTRSSYWSQTALGYINNAEKYKDEINNAKNADSALTSLTKLAREFNVIATEMEGVFPVTADTNVDIMDKIRILSNRRAEAEIKLSDLEKTGF